MILNEQNNGWNLDAVASGFGYKNKRDLIILMTNPKR